MLVTRADRLPHQRRGAARPARDGARGEQDGAAAAATFFCPYGVAVARETGLIYVSEVGSSQGRYERGAASARLSREWLPNPPPPSKCLPAQCASVSLYDLCQTRARDARDGRVGLGAREEE